MVLFSTRRKRLSASNRELLRQAAREFDEACDQFTVTNDPSSWPARLHVKSAVNVPGVLEMTWSFVGPTAERLGNGQP